MKTTISILAVWVSCLWLCVAAAGRADVSVGLSYTSGPDQAVGVPALVHVEPVEVRGIDDFTVPLAPYGTWLTLADYGRVWRPAVAVDAAGWRPYCEGGQWVWSDRGWYWQSSYCWGWAAFHFGRWTLANGIGWVWVPDVVWGPAWVQWRETPTYFGWAPLPPCARYESGIGLFYSGGRPGFDQHFGLIDNDYVFVQRSSFLTPGWGGTVLRGHACGSLFGSSSIVRSTYNGYGRSTSCSGLSAEVVFGRRPAPVVTYTPTIVHRQYYTPPTVIVRPSSSYHTRPHIVQTPVPTPTPYRLPDHRDGHCRTTVTTVTRPPSTHERPPPSIHGDSHRAPHGGSYVAPSPIPTPSTRVSVRTSGGSRTVAPPPRGGTVSVAPASSASRRGAGIKSVLSHR